MRTFEDFIEHRDRAIEAIDSAIGTIKRSEELIGRSKAQEGASSGGGQRNVSSIVGDLEIQKERLLEGLFKVLVVGEFSTGKSTFLNALIREPIIPVGVPPTTAVITVLRDAEAPKMYVHYWDEDNEDGTDTNAVGPEEVSFSELQRFSTSLSRESDEISQKVKTIEIHKPNDFCRNNVEIMDTPGLGSINERHEKITLEYLPRGNACIMLLNPTQPLSKSERDYLRVIRNFVSKVLFVANKIDLLDDAERESALRYMHRELQKELKMDGPLEIFPMDAKTASKQSWEGTGFDGFAVALEEFLTSDDKAVQMIAPSLEVSAGIVRGFRRNLAMNAEALKFSPEEFNAKLAQVRPKLNEVRREEERIRTQFESQRRYLLESTSIELDSMLRQWREDACQYILQWEGDLEELQEAFPSYLKEKLAEKTKEFEKVAQSKLKEYTDKTVEGLNTIIKDINEIQMEFNIDSLDTMGKYAREDELEDVKAMGWAGGGSFAIGLFSALILSGPLGWIAALAGSTIFSGTVFAKLHERKLRKIRDQFREKSEPVADDIRSKCISEMESQMKSYEKDVYGYLHGVINTLEDSINEIQQDMKREKSQIESKRQDLLATSEQLDEIGEEMKAIVGELQQ